MAETTLNTLAGSVPSCRRMRPRGMDWAPIVALCLATCGWGETLNMVKGPHRPGNIPAGKAEGGSAALGTYKFVAIAVPNSSYAVASGINNAGLVAGYYQDSSFNYHGFLWQNGAFQTLDYPGAVNTTLTGVNNLGMVIGYYGDGATNHTAMYSVSGAAWSALPDIPNFSQNDGYCVNDAGTAVGNAFGVSASIAWIWDPVARLYSFFEVPAAAQYRTYPTCINNKNQVSGYYEDGDGVYQGFVKEYGGFTTIAVPETVEAYPGGINNWGMLEGQVVNGSGVARGFAATPGGSSTLVEYPGAAATAVVGINDNGDLCGAYGGAYFQTAAAFVAISQP